MQLFFRQLHKQLKFTLLFYLLSLLSAASIVLQAYSIVQIVHLLFIEKQAFDTTIPFITILAAALMLRLGSNFFMQHTAIHFATSVKQQVRGQLLDEWSVRSYEQLEQQQAGQKISLYVDTVEELDGYYREFIPLKIRSQIVPIVVLISMVFTNVESALILLVTAPFIPISYILIGKKTQAESELQLEAMNRFSGKFLDLLYGLQTLKLFRKTEQQRDVLAQHNHAFTERTMAVLKIAFASTLFVELITTLGIGLIALQIGFEMLVFETLPFVSAFFVLTLAPEFYNALKEMATAFHAQKGSNAAMNVLQTELNKRPTSLGWGHLHVAKAPTLSLKEAVFHYEQGPAIGPITIEVPAKKITALIGPTGHGKSTALQMLAVQLDLRRGNLTINGINQHEIDEKSWYDEMAYVSQHSYVFASSVRENLRMGRDISDESITSSLVRANLTTWFEQLPEGLDTKIGEGASALSGGEKQRMAIARAIVQQPSVLFLDEPTAGLDVLTEQMISDAISSLHDTTIILVTHRFATLRQAQVIYYIENGQVQASGNHLAMFDVPFYEAMKSRGEVV
ncbi:thiol reductant ABC exporter subunit CydD [Solibacillus sp. FSL H8-0523]|uniref:thiol reductant ABC exporter subunit CydD n=1 Tax=Solibacillus sp. FSL H8-0523 TaxID=2954511 RepID=UPI003101940A